MIMTNFHSQELAGKSKTTATETAAASGVPTYLGNRTS